MPNDFISPLTWEFWNGYLGPGFHVEDWPIFPDQAVVEDPVVSLLDLVTVAGVSSHWFVISVCRAERLAEFDVECCNLWCCF